jgi:hypothetical protein
MANIGLESFQCNPERPQIDPISGQTVYVRARAHHYCKDQWQD